MNEHAKHRRLKLVVALLSVSLPSVVWAWSPVPAGPNAKGQFEQQKVVTTNPPPPRQLVQLRWKPPAAGAPCAKTAFVQTISEHYILSDGTQEILTKPSDHLKGIDRATMGPEGRKFYDRAKTEYEVVLDPNTVNGHTVDSEWCDKDPYYNGDDRNDQHPMQKQGSRTTPTEMVDGPNRGDVFFTGNRKTYVMTAEVCAYCMNDDGTVGQVLDCVTWTYRRTKGQQTTGTVTVPPGPTASPSQSHTAAVAKFVQRHTRRKPDGTLEKYCPPAEKLEELRDQLRELNWEIQEMGQDHAEFQQKVTEFKRVLEEFRRLRRGG